jgi:hypothetical protein
MARTLSPVPTHGETPHDLRLLLPGEISGPMLSTQAAPSSFVVCGFTGQVAKSEQLAFGFASFMDVISRGGSKDPETEISLLSNVVL